MAVLLLGGLLCLPACSKSEEGNDTNESLPVLGVYEFDGTQYNIVRAESSSDDYYLTFVFSPLAPTAELTTYVAFGVRHHWVGSEVNIEDVDHNDDYVFMYEDPIWCYSNYRRPLGGTFTVEENGNNVYTVKIDFTLPDGKPFHIDFTGDFE